MDNAFASIYIRIFTKRYSSLIQKFSGVSIIDKNPSPSVHTDLVGIKLAQPGTLTHRYSFLSSGLLQNTVLNPKDPCPLNHTVQG